MRPPVTREGWCCPRSHAKPALHEPILQPPKLGEGDFCKMLKVAPSGPWKEGK